MSNPGKLSPLSPDPLAGSSAALSPMDSWGMTKPTLEIDLPSGAKCSVRSLEIATMVELDILDKMDAFTPKVLGTSKRKKPTEERITPEKMADLITIMDKVVVSCVVSPKISAKPPEGEEEVVGKRYVHLIPVADKLKIFEASFRGMDELFRISREQIAAMGAMEEVEGIKQIPE